MAAEAAPRVEQTDIVLTGEGLDDIRQVAEKYGVSVDTALQGIIAMGKLALDNVEEGYEVQFVPNGGADTCTVNVFNFRRGGMNAPRRWRLFELAERASIASGKRKR